MTLMLLVSASISVQGQEKYSVSVSKTETVENGTIDVPREHVAAGTTIKIYCEPNQGYGLSTGLYYAVKNSSGGWSDPKLAKCESDFPDDRANKQEFSIVMPAADVEVWATFTTLRTLVIHPAVKGGGWLRPLYGRGREADADTNVVKNVPLGPVVFEVKPDTGYELVEVDVQNDSFWQMTGDSLLTVNMPKKNETVHVTPTFGKNNYEVKIKGDSRYLDVVELSTTTPKAREEVVLTLVAKEGYIPYNISFEGCKSSWRVGKPERQKDGRWKVVYRFKVDFKDVTVEVNALKVYSFTVKDTKNTGRVQTYIPEMIPDFPGVALEGKQIPVIFTMPKNFAAKYTYSGTASPKVYHNALTNSFAEQGMIGWRESNEYVSAGLPIKTETDTTGNECWRTSVKNVMSQAVPLKGRSFPLSIAAIATINSCHADTAEVSIIPSFHQKAGSKQVVADLSNRKDGWQTVFKTLEISSAADTLQYVVTAVGDDPNKKHNYGGPMFDDLCLLLPTKGDSINNEDVLVFTMSNKDVTINFTPLTQQNLVTVKQTDHAQVTLLNANTGEQGNTIMAMDNDIIKIKAKCDEGYGVQSMKYVQDKKARSSYRDSINVATREVDYHFIMHFDKDVTVTPAVDVLKVNIDDHFGGLLTVEEEVVAPGEKVVINNETNPGCKLKQIRTFPENIVTITADDVDATTGSGKYSFIMPNTQVTLIPEYIVPITSIEQIDSINLMPGEFNLVNDLVFEEEFESPIVLSGHLNGNGHQITYHGSTSLIESVEADASVRHLYVNARVSGTDMSLGGLAQYNEGLIEDCEVRGTVKNDESGSVVGGLVGQNGPNGGIISHCHVLSDEIDGPAAYGIASQKNGATLKNNIFNGKFAHSDGLAYMIGDEEGQSTVAGNYYIASEGNARALIGSGVTAAQPDDLVNMVKEMDETYPVFAASVKRSYKAFTITVSQTSKVKLESMSAETSAPGMVVSATVKVSGNNHLDEVIVSASDGSDKQSIAFTDNTENVYSFSFVMPAHDVIVSFKTEVGSLIYTFKQFTEISDKKGTYILAKDLELNNWNKKMILSGKFYGNGHTIKYDATGSFRGLFHRIRKNSLLQGLRVVGNVEADEDCAGIAYENQGTIRDCHFCGRISRVNTPMPSMNRVAAISFSAGKSSLIDHCSATGELISASNQDAINKSPLCAQSDAKKSESYWINGNQTDTHQQLLNIADATHVEYPVFAQGIYDKISVGVVTGSDTIHVLNGQTLDELTLNDDEPFVCTGDLMVNRIVYKRRAEKSMQLWVLPFGFDQIASEGKLTYHKVVRNQEMNMPDIETGGTLTLTDQPQSLEYNANAPWLVSGDGSDMKTYVLTNATGPISVKATFENHIARYASVLDVANFYATYEGIPAETAKDNLLYVWDNEKLEFVLSDGSADIHPYRYYMQFHNQNAKTFVTYENTWWGKHPYETASQSGAASSRDVASSRGFASLMTDGWQPVFLDPRQPQSVTGRMLDNYEVAYLADARCETLDEDTDAPLSVVSLVYQMVDSRMDLPSALPLLVRAKRSDAEPLYDATAVAELDSLYTLSLMSMLIENDNEDDDDDLLYFEMPHYWCASFGNRLDIWQLPAPATYADLAEYGCMMFNDNYFDQSFNYATATDSRSTAPMSYCITVINTDKFEFLPLMGNRVNVEFIKAADATGIESLTPTPSPKGEGSSIFNLSGQRVGASYKGIILNNGRKIYKR